MTTTTSRRRSVVLPSARVLIGGVYLLCVGGLLAIFTGVIILSDQDPHRHEGPIDSIIAVGSAGTAALVVAVVAGRWLVRNDERARVGAWVFAALSIVTMVFFWAGAPGIFGAAAAWQAGLTKGRRPLEGSPRVAGIIGLFVAIVNVVLSIGGVGLAAVL